MTLSIGCVEVRGVLGAAGDFVVLAVVDEQPTLAATANNTRHPIVRVFIVTLISSLPRRGSAAGNSERLAFGPQPRNILPDVQRTFARASIAVLLLGLLLATSNSRAAQFLNLSTRGFVGSSDHALIGGFILKGSIAKRLLLRGIGPSLTDAGVSEILSDPTLELRDQNGVRVFANNDWQETQKIEIEQTGLAPKNDREAAMVVNLLAPGSYTAILRGAGGGTGIGLIEIYDLSPTSGSLLANLSARGFVEPGDRAMIAGFIVGGGDPLADIILRGIGPSLSKVGIIDYLADPTLDLLASGGRLLIKNDDWKKGVQQSLIEQSGIPPEDDRESAIAASLGGHYTAILRGKPDSSAGTALVELYHLNASPNPTASFSFENGLDGWIPKATDTDHPTVTWSIAPSQERAVDGTSSAKLALENLNDAGKIWLERLFNLRPNRSYHVKVQFSFGTADWGDANHWTIIAGVRTSPAVTRSDLTYQGLTSNGESSNTGYKWLEKSYEFDLLAGADGALYIDLGVWGTWETYRAYYIDNVRITVSEN